MSPEIGSFTVGGSGTGDTLTLAYDATTYVITGDTVESYASNKFLKAGGATATALNIASFMNSDGDSPVYAHAVGTTIYIARRTIGSGELVTTTGGGMTWRDEAACVGDDPNLFFRMNTENPRGGWTVQQGAEAAAKTLEAHRICGTCPVQQECLNFAVRTPYLHDHGIWAGTNPAQRQTIRNKRFAA